MASGTKHFLFNRPDDWLASGVLDGLEALPDGLTLPAAGKGLYVSRALDTLSEKTVWHRLRMTAGIPGNTLVRLSLYCSDSSRLPPSFQEGAARELDDWLEDPAVPRQERERFFRTCAQNVFENPQDLLLYEFTGRYLWFCLEFSSYDGRAVRVEKLKLEFPRTAFLDYLPQVYRGADSVNSFLARFISVFQSIYVDLEDDIDLAPVRCDPVVAPPEFLGWLAQCLAVSDSFLWPEDRLRLLLQNAVRLYRLKGTKTALKQLIELYTGRTPMILEQFDTAGSPYRRLYGESRYTFTVLMPPGDWERDAYAKLSRVIEPFKPADAICNLVFLENTILLGRHCYLGINSCISRSQRLTLGAEPGGSGPPYLDELPAGGFCQ